MANALLKYFSWQHLPPKLQTVSKPICELAEQLDQMLPDGPEKTTALRKLLEAKDCAVRAAMDAPPASTAFSDEPCPGCPPGGWCTKLPPCGRAVLAHERGADIYSGR